MPLAIDAGHRTASRVVARSTVEGVGRTAAASASQHHQTFVAAVIMQPVGEGRLRHLVEIRQ